MRRTRSVGHLFLAPWIWGLTKAKEHLFTGDLMTGVETVEWGWANHAYPAERLEEETERLAARIAQIPAEVLMLSKRACNRTFEMMGLGVALEYAEDVLVLDHLGRGNPFQDVVRRQGLKAAVHWRDENSGPA